MKMLYGKPIAQHILDKVRDTIYECQIEPEMVVYCANPDEPYYKGILKDAKFCGIKVRDGYLSDSCGAISLDSEHYIPSRNNLDGGEYIPCTAHATLSMLHSYQIPISGRQVCVIGRSERVGRPLAKLLLDEDATVVVCHSKTTPLNMGSLIRTSDIVISCVGGQDFSSEYPISPNATVVDIGGDFQGLKSAQYFVPHIGGVGLLTRAFLMVHALDRWARALSDPYGLIPRLNEQILKYR